RTAASEIGTPYVWGGTTPGKGFDCSGLVQHSLAQGANVRIPRTAAEQYAASVKVANGQASRGDLVFFRTHGGGVSHVGIYLGNGKFLHAPRKGKTVTVSTISGYWQDRLIGFGRIPGACKLPLPMV
ncbi:MAG TPA: C40 family peptidase, partial [Thiolinea sp.]|nr:C40 family peptidase [Thiolinea sp.]